MHNAIIRGGARRGSGVRIGLVWIALLVTACGSSSKESSPTTSTTPTPTTSAPGSTTAPSGSSPVSVYLVAHEHLVTAGRVVPGAATPETAVRALLLGPQSGVEHDLGFTSAIPAGTTLRSVAVAGDTATVDLSSRFASGGGSLAMQERVAQIVFTVTQFRGVTHVRFQLDGAAVSTIGGEGLMVDNVDRGTFANVTPLILVESPTPGQAVRSPIRVHGMSNTFEATVNYTLTDPDGRVLVEGHTTATAGSGTWGTFSFDVPFKSGRAGVGHLVAYEISPKDGSHVNVTSIPVEMS